MKTTSSFCLVVIASMVLATASNAAGTTPEVTSTHPKNHDQNVPAALREVIVVFDQDMDISAFSFVGGGPSFPKLNGKPFWKDKRTCVLPVELAADQAYWIGINSATHTNFKNRAGEPAKPTALEFRTSAAGGKPAKGADGGNGHAQSLMQLQDAIRNRYSYRDVHRVDWPAVYATYEKRLTGARTPLEFASTAGEMLAATKDPHIWLMEGGQIVPAFRANLVPNANGKVLPSLIQGWTQHHPMVFSGKAADGIGYIAIHSWEKKHQPRATEAALQALSTLEALPALVIDVRFNTGGDELRAREFAGCFVGARSLYARHVVLDATSSTGFSTPAERWLEPAQNRVTYKGRLAVLMGGANMSSAEAFLLMMRQVPGCKLVGARSLGASGNPQPHLLANGVTVYLPSWKAMLPDGTELEMRGITPDVEVKAGTEAFAASDPVLDAALKLLRQ